MKKIPVAVLAATGSVGQRFIALLADHPWFEVTAITGSDRTVGSSYSTGCKWLLAEAMPKSVRDLTVLPSEVKAISGTPIVFSALPADLAKTIEPEFAHAGMSVFSNASAFRTELDVPILLPEVNPQHLSVIPSQQAAHGWKGCIVTNPNCTSTGITVALKAIKQSFGLNKVFAVSMQALSGAGYPGVPSMDIIDNVIPYIGGEEEKIEFETRKMLGEVLSNSIQLAPCMVSAHANRVAVSDGHMVCLSIEMETKPEVAEVIHALRAYQAPLESRDLPSTPKPVIMVRDEADRPQPRLDRMAGKGMTTSVGRVRKDPMMDIKMVVLSHNTIRGAAGGSIYNAELFAKLNQLI